MRKIDLKLETVTPAFIGGATPAAEWRAASVRGQLRFWFRALAGGELRGDLERVRVAERNVFGATDASSAVIVRTTSTKQPVGAPRVRPRNAAALASAWGDPSPGTEARLRLVGGDGRERPSDPVRYLGYGPFDKGASCFAEATPLGLSLVWRREPAERGLFDRALWAWLNLGGIGSRSRRGFGSLRCTDTKLPPGMEQLAPTDLASFEAGLREAFGSALESPAGSWTTVAKGSQVFIAPKACSSGAEALAQAGSWLSAFRRRYGYPKDSRAGIGADYQWARDPGAQGAQLPDRAGFGLPLAFDRNAVRVRQVQPGRTPTDPRRASPLFVHVARLGRDAHVVLTRLSGRFLPFDHRLDLYRSQSSRTVAAPPTCGMESVVARFLADLQAKGLVNPLLP